MLRSSRMILKEGGSTTFSLLVTRMGFKKIEDVRTSASTGDRVTTTWEIDNGLKIVFTSDKLSKSEYVQVFGDESESVSGVAETLGELGTYGYEDLLHAYRAASSIEEKSLSLIRIGVGAPPTADDEFCDCIIDALKSQESDLRKAGLWGASFYAMRKFIPFIQEIVHAETDEDLKETAGADA
ncbi:hypothetical protein ACFRMN_30785 [Streptomyces sp. NPDC056835]|uniref:hypothetical protein n=1 Tax=Streptomyces sp. NPDC056835 TaxID=3345956 RepID=UPI0036C9BC27